MKEALSTTESLYHGLNMASQTIFNTANQLVNMSPPVANAIAQVATGLTNLAGMIRAERQESILTATDPALVALKRALGDKLPDLAWKPLQLATDVPIGPVTGLNENYAFTKEHLNKGRRFLLAIRRRLDKEYGKDVARINARLAELTKTIPLHGTHENLCLEITGDYTMQLTISDGGFHHTLELTNSNFLGKYKVQSRYTDEVFDLDPRSIGVQWVHEVLYSRLFWELEIEINELESLPQDQVILELQKCDEKLHRAITSVTHLVDRFEEDNIPQTEIIFNATYVHGNRRYNFYVRPNCPDNDVMLLGGNGDKALEWEILPRALQKFIIDQAHEIMTQAIIDNKPLPI